jgi:hypothetical protein
MVECYSRPVQERFIASRWSLAYLFCLAFYIAVAVCPIYIAYSSGGALEKQRNNAHNSWEGGNNSKTLETSSC